MKPQAILSIQFARLRANFFISRVIRRSCRPFIESGKSVLIDKPVAGLGSGSFRREYRRQEKSSSARASAASRASRPIGVMYIRASQRMRKSPVLSLSMKIGRATFAEGASLRFKAEATRERHENLGLFRSDYVQPFGTFTGTLPGCTASDVERALLSCLP